MCPVKNNKIIAIIPARGGSKGIPKKNVRLMCGKPLISYSIINGLNSKFNLDVVVSTDDIEIERIALSYGAKVIRRPEELAKDCVTLDPVIYHALCEMEKKTNDKYDYVITMQSTSPLLKTDTLDSAISYAIENSFDTVISVVNHPCLFWTEIDSRFVPLYKERLNRQCLPKILFETGAFLITKREFVKENTRFGPNISIYEVPENESVDIDSPKDWLIAEKEFSKKSILVRTDGYSNIGLGHIYRCLVLAHNLIGHDVKFVLSNKSDIGIKIIEESNFDYVVIKDDYDIGELVKKFNCDIIINDILDTKKKYIKYCKSLGVRVVNFEDLGDGAKYADAVINDLYDKKNDYRNHYWGSDYYCVRDEFLLARPAEFKRYVEEVLIIFGGTDPCNLTRRLLEVISSIQNYNKIHYTIILGMGFRYVDELVEKVNKLDLNVEIVRDVKLMTEYMCEADIAISSQGRTMLELACMAVPTILLAQNKREQHHEFGCLQNGFINLGLGSEVENETIRQTLIWLINSPQIRRQMKDQMLKKDLRKGTQRVINIILGQDIS